ncbi:MAG: hypothetical protein KDI88_19390, partial [Gammaproteobacteria bacterium]|nr:hypothetical protein [Gammaproteobacteria bacterium]
TVKIAGNDEGRTQCQKEYDNLGLLQQLQVPGVICAHRLGQFDIDGDECFVQSAITSAPCYDMLKPNTRRYSASDFHWITRKLVAIHQHTAGHDPESDSSTCF